MSREPSWIKRLRTELPGEVETGAEALKARSGDKWFASQMPDAVVLARSRESVVKVMRLASKFRVPVTARGGGYGYVGGCVPIQGGIVLSLEQMRRIKEIHAADFVAVVEPGVITQTLQEAVERKGLFYPPDPASRANCTLGGNIATNAGGPRCLKYGVTQDYVLGLECVLANGSVVQMGGRTHKNKTGFDLARLMTGSEGLLAVVTEATLKLLPLPPFRACASIGFESMKGATRCIGEIFRAGFLPSALEIADAFTLKAVLQKTGSRMLAGCRAHLIVELDGQERSVRSELRQLEAITRRAGPLFFRRALGEKACESIWQLRREFSFALRDTGLTKLNEDIVVPRGQLERLFRLAEGLQKRHGLPVACFGHAGDGNIHVNLMVDAQAALAMERCEEALDELFRGVLALGGVITGEHGIGLAKKRWWPLATSPELRRVHSDLKKSFDPLGILNPGKFL